MNQQNYKQKYLKYKEKYLNLKNEIGGWKQNHEYIKKVPEFESDTKSDSDNNFINSTERNLNTITIHGIDSSSNDYEAIKINIESNIRNGKINSASIPNTDEFNEFVELLKANSDKIIEIYGFYNINKNYKDNQTEGTYVNESDVDIIFKSTSKSNIPIKTKKVSGAVVRGFFASDGIGKKHLNQRMLEYKAKGVKYVMLYAAGDSDLVGLYTKYGFTNLVTKFDMYMNIDGNLEYLEEADGSLMFGNIDTIIEKTN
jgi:hypothetical protein